VGKLLKQRMGRRIDYAAAKMALTQAFELAEKDFQKHSPPDVDSRIAEATAVLFSSATQAFREAIIGCALARIVDPEINIRLPYMKQDINAFSGRQLDEHVVNSFLRDHAIPCSTGPYLSAIRRNFKFVEEAADRGIRDAEAFKAFLQIVSVLEQATETDARSYLRYLLYWFLDLREGSDVKLARVKRLSVEQYDILVSNLLPQASGGLIPVLLAVAMFQTIRMCFNLSWKIEWQGINVADRATGVGGDITITDGDRLVMAVEVTEREIDRKRVVSTFTAKIAPGAIDDYLFLFARITPTTEAREAARQYFGQGHEINFIPLREWIRFVLGTIGPKCRELFTANILEVLQDNRVPASIRVAWNEQLAVRLNPPVKS